MRATYWALFSWILFVISAADDDLIDFDFTDLKDVDWDYGNGNTNIAAEEAAKKKLESNMLDFAVDIEDNTEKNHIPQFDWREKVLRNALSKALTDKSLRQKFAEVMPILRLLSSQQRLALSALISAQMNAKQGHELKLDQVRMMFGDDKKLLLPIVFDLANLVKCSTRKYIQLDSGLNNKSELRQIPIDRRDFELTSAEEDQEAENVGTLSISEVNKQDDGLVQFFADMPADVLDPQLINEELQAEMEFNQTTTATRTRTTAKAAEAPVKRARRAVTEFVHKLVRSVPLTTSEKDLLSVSSGHDMKLNTTAFQQLKENQVATQSDIPDTSHTTSSSSISSTESSDLNPAVTQTYAEIEDLAFAGLNGTEMKLNQTERLDNANDELLPSPEELIAGPRYRLAAGHKLPIKRNKIPLKRKRINQSHTIANGALRTANDNRVIVPPPKKCERFTSLMCIRTDDYPHDQIMGSIRRHKNAMSALLAEYYDKPNKYIEFRDDFDDYLYNKKRREDDATAGGMCQSVVRYARPQKARSASGDWKYIVNTGQHTQTLRLEKCSNPGDSCSYLAQTYRSHCSQVYNYHRLLSWDKVRGLHVDIFKVPTCCSCQVDGYRQQFPPLSSVQSKDFTSAAYNLEHNNGYSNINEDDLDYNDESIEDDLSFATINNGISQQHQPYNHHHQKAESHYEPAELYLGSKTMRTKVADPPTVGAYLSPPDKDRQTDYGYKEQEHKATTASVSLSTDHKKYYSQFARRRPYNEARVDLDLSPSETYADKEVNTLGASLANDKQRVPQKRKRIYSAPRTATTGGTAKFTITTRTVTNAAHAHQAQHSNVAATSAKPSTATNYINRNYIRAFGSNSSKSRPRFYAPGTVEITSTPYYSNISSSSSNNGVKNSTAATLSTKSTYWQQQKQQQQQQHKTTTSTPPIYQVNSIYTGSYYNGTGVKRINYSYHPIIDFFNKNKDIDVITPRQNYIDIGESDAAAAVERIYPYRILSSSALSPTTPDIISNVGSNIFNAVSQKHAYTNDNVWHPMVVQS